MRPANFSILIIILILSSCKPKVTGNIISHSPDNGITIIILGVRPMVAEPWSVTLRVKAYNLKESKIMFEVYGNGLNEQNVKFDWENNNHCTITVRDRNEKPRMFRLVADSTQASINEI